MHKRCPSKTEIMEHFSEAPIKTERRHVQSFFRSECYLPSQRQKITREIDRVRCRLQQGSMKNKQWWSTLKAAGGDGRQCSIPVVRDDQGREHTTNKDKAECFGKFFSTKCSLRNDLQRSNLPAFPNRCTAALSHVRFRPATVARLLRQLDLSKATGPDGVPARVLKICAAELSSPLSSLFSACCRQGVCPSLWTANVMPVHKKQARSSMRNYRRVSLLSVVSKVMEKVINTTLTRQLTRQARRSFFLTVIQPDLEYSAVACVPNMPEFQKQRLLTLWRKAVRCVAGAECHADVDPICKELSLTPLDHRWALKFAMLVTRCYMNQAPASLCRKLKRTSHHRSTRGNNMSLHPFKPSSLSGILSFSNRSPILWNALQSVPNLCSLSLSKFKKVFTKLLLDSPKYISNAVGDVNRYT